MLAVAEEMAAEEVEEGKIRFFFLHADNTDVGSGSITISRRFVKTDLMKVKKF